MARNPKGDIVTRILYGVMSQGQGHINRSAAMIERLREKGHEVQVFVAGNPPPPYTQEVLGPFTFAHVPYFVLRNGKLHIPLTVRNYITSLPARRRAIQALTTTLRRNKTELVLTDFEPISAKAARCAGVPVAGIAGQYRIVHTDCSAPNVQPERLIAFLVGHAWTPGLDRYFAVSFSAAKSRYAHTQVVGPLLGKDVLAQRPTQQGFHLAYLYAYTRQQVIESLAPYGRFRVYGMGPCKPWGDIEFCATDRKAFVGDLAACEGVIFNGSFQAVCEAAMLGKPMLSIPFQGQYEELFNAHLIEHEGLGHAAPTLTPEAVGNWIYARQNLTPPALPDGVAQILEALAL